MTIAEAKQKLIDQVDTVPLDLAVQWSQAIANLSDAESTEVNTEYTRLQIEREKADK